MKFNLTNFANTVSFILDHPGIGVIDGFTLNHSKRVAYIAARIADILQVGRMESKYLYFLSLLHDIGISEGFRDFHLQEQLIKDHCTFGEKHINSIIFTGASDVQNTILYHHERYDGNGPFHIAGMNMPIYAKIISAADHFDLFFKHDKFYYYQLNEIGDYLSSYKGKIFDPEIQRILCCLCKQEKFWLDFQQGFTHNLPAHQDLDLIMEINLEQLLILAGVFAVVIDNKSRFTATHSTHLADKLTKMAAYYRFNENKKKELTIAALLHDIGKLVVPKSILEKTSLLSPDEYEKMKSHAYYTRVVLQNLKELGNIIDWASNHHEKNNGLGYPERIIPRSFEEQLICCLDVFQALTEDRPYRNRLETGEAFRIISGMTERNELNKDIVADLKKVFPAG